VYETSCDLNVYLTPIKWSGPLFLSDHAFYNHLDAWTFVKRGKFPNFPIRPYGENFYENSKMGSIHDTHYLVQHIQINLKNEISSVYKTSFTFRSSLQKTHFQNNECEPSVVRLIIL